VTLTNALVDPKEGEVPEHSEWWYGPADTNLHFHGLQADTGVPSQATATECKVKHTPAVHGSSSSQRCCGSGCTGSSSSSSCSDCTAAGL
jgi:hypothetical protein